MREEKKPSKITTLARGVDRAIGIVAPKTAFRRARYRFAYEAIDSSRTRRKRSGLGGTGDSQLSEAKLYKLREICREMCRNNPLIAGLLRSERDGLIGSGVKIHALTGDKAWNDRAEALWHDEMVLQPCDVTGRYNFNQFLRMLFLSYRRDGDALALFTSRGLQGIEGEQLGSPTGRVSGERLTISNGVAYEKATSRVYGYYIGKPSRYGFIDNASYKRYHADEVYHMFDPDRFSQSRGEPVLTPAIKYIDYLEKYLDAELVAACVNAAFAMFISSKDDIGAPGAYAEGLFPSGQTGTDEGSKRPEKITPGMILYGKDGEDAKGIGQVRPGSIFDPFVCRMLTFIGRPLCMPLMLITLDFAGATFMNARIAYQKTYESWTAQQDNIIKPFVSRVWRWKIGHWIAAGLLSDVSDAMKHEVGCKRWPYVNPLQEANADKVQLENRTTDRRIICARQGLEYSDVAEQLKEESGDENGKEQDQNAA